MFWRFSDYFIPTQLSRKLGYFVAVLLLAEIFQLCIPWQLGRVIDGIVAEESVWSRFGWLALVAIGYLVVEQFSNAYIAKIAWNWKSYLRERLLEAWCYQQPEEAECWRQGEAGMKFMRDVPILGEALQHGIPQLFRAVFMFILALVTAFYQCWQIGLIILLAIPCLLAIHYGFRTRFRTLAHQSRLVQDELCSKVFEFLNAYPELKALNSEGHYRGAVSGHLHEIGSVEYANVSNHISFQRCFAILLLLCEYAVLGVACLFACRGRLPVGQIIFFQVMIMRVLNGAVGILQMLPQLVSVVEARNSLLTLLKDTSSESLKTGRQLSCPIEGIDLTDVTFAYAGGERNILNGYSLSLSKGEVVALEGINGIGKTTLWKLLSGWMCPDKGSITVNNIPIENVIDDYRRRISFVTQRTLLFYGALLENITLGETEFSREKLEFALRVSGFDKVVERFPQGLKKHIENNAGLSGGECQRLALARALYRRPEVLILDEVTNHMDTSGKELVKSLIQEMRGKMIIVVISHEADIRSLCDREVVLQ